MLTPYRSVFFDDYLLFARKKFEIPSLEFLAQEDDLSIYRIGAFRFYWPREFGASDLLGLYSEVFAPAPLNPHAYEYGQIRIASDSWVIDAGACEGFFTQYALEKNAKVLVIEPVPALVDALQHTFRNEITEGRVKVLWGALGDKVGEVQLTIDPKQAYCAYVGSEGESDVPAYTIDSLVNDGIIPNISLIKMDIEGFETTAIQGAKETIARYKPQCSIAVYHEYHNAMIIKQFLQNQRSDYTVKWRGVFYRPSFGKPRPYMLYAY